MSKGYNLYHRLINVPNSKKFMEEFSEFMKSKDAFFIRNYKKSFEKGNPCYKADYLLNGVVIDQIGLIKKNAGCITTYLISSKGTKLSPLLKIIRKEFDKNF